MIVHICCSVDSWYFLSRLAENLAQTRLSERLIAYFYNPNIHPRGEYLARLADAKRSCDRLGIEFCEGEYDLDAFVCAARGLEDEAEKGARCAACFDLRLERAAKFALERGETRFTTTLLQSPKKDFAQLRASAGAIAARHGLEFVFADFRSGGGTQTAFALARQRGAYFQDYCGCLWGLSKQRSAQGRFAAELSSPVDRGAETSADRRFFAARDRALAEAGGEEIRLYKRKIMSWRLLSGFLRDQNGVLVSKIARNSASFHAAKAHLVTCKKSGVWRFEKQAGFVILRDVLNGYDPREFLELENYDITPIFVVNYEPFGAVACEIKSIFFEETLLAF
ncbi:MAG: epoxyqueuosine reductase QueH [Helicobacteraceae bacterium]|jgi:predicted adenine nucleotide alpha hydrolase (AANH) superfamily ATPase|nr:epoxyqueuosine reductase QueH [Helicobacteraceae bacterium]